MRDEKKLLVMNLVIEHIYKPSNDYWRREGKYKRGPNVRCVSCNKIQREGYDIYMNTWSRCRHYVSLTFNGKYICRGCNYESRWKDFKNLECELCDTWEEYKKKSPCPVIPIFRFMRESPGETFRPYFVRKKKSCEGHWFVGSDHDNLACLNCKIEMEYGDVNYYHCCCNESSESSECS